MLSKNQLGFLYMFLSVCAFSIMDLIVKWSDNYPLGQVIFFRGFFGLVFYYFIIISKEFRLIENTNISEGDDKNPKYDTSEKPNSQFVQSIYSSLNLIRCSCFRIEESCLL